MVPWPAIVVMCSGAALLIVLRLVTWAILAGRRLLGRTNPRPGYIDLRRRRS